MAITQLSVFLNNIAGRLAEVTRILGEHGVNIRGFSLADNVDFGILRLIVSQEPVAIKALKDAKFTVHEGTVVLARVPDVPGGLAAALAGFAQRGVNVEYAYAIVNSIIAFGVEDVEAAEAILQQEGIPLVTPEEITAM